MNPTLCDLAGLAAPDACKGQSLHPVLTDDASPRDSLLLAYEDVQRAVREERFKLIEYYVDGDRHIQLFDTRDDPRETNDLSGEASHADDLEQLRDRLVHCGRRN